MTFVSKDPALSAENIDVLVCFLHQGLDWETCTVIL